MRKGREKRAIVGVMVVNDGDWYSGRINNADYEQHILLYFWSA